MPSGSFQPPPLPTPRPHHPPPHHLSLARSSRSPHFALRSPDAFTFATFAASAGLFVLAAAVPAAHAAVASTASPPTPSVSATDLPTILRAAGRFHVVAVHFPIALLLVAALTELLAAIRRKAEITATAVSCTVLGALAAALAAWLGWLNADFEPQARALANTLWWHRWLGVTAAGAALLAALLALIAASSRRPAFVRWTRLVLVLSALGVGVAGHFGGSLVHGEDYLWEILTAPKQSAPRSTVPSFAATGNATDPAARAPGVLAGPSTPTPSADADPSQPRGAEASQDAPQDQDEIPGANNAAGPTAAGNRGAGDGGRVVFATQIRPIFETRCVECHGPAKKKAGVRLDAREHVFTPDESEWVIVPGDPRASVLLHRISLPVGDPDIMPPEEPALSSEQIALIRAWIEQGAVWDDGPPPASSQGIPPGSTPPGAISQPAPPPAAPEQPVSANPSDPPGGAAPGVPHAADTVRFAAPAENPDRAATRTLGAGVITLEAAAQEAQARVLAALRARGCVAQRIAQDTHAVEVSFAGATAAAPASPAGGGGESGGAGAAPTKAGDSELALLAGLEDSLVKLDLTGTRVTDAGIARLAKFSRLRTLSLARTPVTDAALASLALFAELEHLNLHSTPVTDAGVQSLRALPALKRVYLWGTKVTDAGVEAFKAANPQLNVFR